MTMTQSSDPQVLSIIDNLRQLSVQVKEIDNELGVDVAGPVAQRNKLANQYITQFSGNENFSAFITKVVSAIRDSFSGSPELQTAVVYELNNQIQKNFGDTVKNYLTKQIDAQPKQDTPSITDERRAELASKRSNLTNIFKLQKEMLKYYDVLELPTDIEEPSTRRGSIGPRGAKFTKDYMLYFDGKLQQLTDSDGNKSNASLSNIATTKLKDLNWKTKELRDFIIETLGVTPSADGKTVELPETWEVTLPAPVSKSLKGVATTAVSVDESDDDDDDDAEENGSDDSGEDMFASA